MNRMGEIRAFSLFIALLCFFGIKAQTPSDDNPDFFIDTNGVTCVCTDAADGDTGSFSGVVYTKRSLSQLQALIAADPADTEIALTCTSGITNMDSLFLSTSFNQDISSWDVSNVTSMSQMFREATVFNQNINTWDVSSVENMSFMFFQASTFNQSLNNWIVSSVDNMSFMFTFASSFNQNINSWDVSGVVLMTGTFGLASTYNQPLDNWDVSSVTNMSQIFTSATNFDQPLNTWDVSSVENMSFMFYLATSFNQPLDNWIVSGVDDMSSMFREATNFNQSLNSWDVSSVTDMSNMFRDATTFDQPLNNWNVSSVITTESMFRDATAFNGDLNNWNLSSAQNLTFMFYGASSFNKPINNWNVSNVSNIRQMFREAIAFNQPLENWDVSNISDMDGLFANAESFNQPLNNWNVSNVLDMNAMFFRAFDFNQPLNDWDVSNVTNMRNMFLETTMFNQALDNWDVSNVTDMFGMFQGPAAFNLPLHNWDVSNVNDMGQMFRSNTAFNQPLDSWDVSNVTNMQSMFNNATSFSQDISTWCVDVFGSEPVSFDNNAPIESMPSFQPNWGQECSYTWKGTIDNDWNNVENWLPNKVPDGNENSIIDPQTNQPIVTASVEAASRNISISSGSTLDVFGVLKINNDLQNDGSITFKSTASGSGQLGEFNGTISGSGIVKTERFIPAGDNNFRAFRLLSPSITTLGTIRDNWQEGVNNPDTSSNLNPNSGYGTHISGSSSGANGFDATQTGTPSLFTFDANTQSWVSVPNTDMTHLIAGNGYLLMVRGDRSTNLNSNNPPTSNTILRNEGSLITGAVNYDTSDLVQADGQFNLLGNPYQAILDYGSTQNTGLTDYIYVWDASIGGVIGVGGYVSVEIPSGANQVVAPGVGISDANQYIAPGQAFFVQNDSDTGTDSTITIAEIDKNVTQTQVTVFNTYSNFFINSKLYKTSDLLLGETASDGIGIRFNSSYTTLADEEDAVKFINANENFAIVNNGLRSIDKQNLPQDNHEIELSITNFTDTNYSLTFEIDNQPSDVSVYLSDIYTGIQTELFSGTVYDFNVDASIPESSSPDRFSLIFDTSILSTNDSRFGENFSLYPNPSTTGIFKIKTPKLIGMINASITNTLGQLVFSQNLSIQNQEVLINAEKLSTGTYLITLTQNDNIYTTKFILK